MWTNCAQVIEKNVVTCMCYVPRTSVLQLHFVGPQRTSVVFVTHQCRSPDALGENVDDKTTLASTTRMLVT